jgi:hypothetical protein
MKIPDGLFPACHQLWGQPDAPESFLKPIGFSSRAARVKCYQQEHLPLATPLSVWQLAAMMIASENQIFLTRAAAMKK